MTQAPKVQKSDEEWRAELTPEQYHIAREAGTERAFTGKYWNEPMNHDAVITREDNSLFMRRTEVLCANCGAHLGHLFDDGPNPTGMRYCINSAILDLAKKQEADAAAAAAHAQGEEATGA